MSDVRNLAPVTEEDYTRVLEFLRTERAYWEAQFESGMGSLIRHLQDAGYRPRMSTAPTKLEPAAVVVSGRLKECDTIVAKMRRFGEPLRVMLDIWGYRVVAATERQLDEAAATVAALWETPAPDELLLRQGTLQFDWRRDYRRRNHVGLSAASTATYDHAIHINRRAPFGIVEVQVLTLDLYQRVHGDPASQDRHERYVARREELFRGR